MHDKCMGQPEIEQVKLRVHLGLFFYIYFKMVLFLMIIESYN